ncbi:MAG: PHP domain-containing protein [Nanoarchaeota archaeon]
MTERKLVMDLHIHTHHSSDSNTHPNKIIKRAKEMGVNVLGITDHDTVEGAKEVKKMAPEDIIVLLGQEIRTNDGEIIIYGLEETLPNKKDLIETCKLAKEKGGFIVTPHPFDKLRHGAGERLEEIIPYIDAIEVFNSHVRFDKFNEKAKFFAEKNKIPMVVGSDSHHHKEIGNTTNTVFSKFNEKSVLEAIKSGNVVMKTKKASIIYNVMLGMTKFKKKLKRKLRKMAKI